jgi:hypothetical protein
MNRRYFLTAAFMLIIFLSFLPSSFAIYQWVDEHGVLHIADYPKPGSQPAEKEQPVTPATSAPVKKTTPPAETKTKDSRTAEQPVKQAPAGVAPATQDAKTGKPVGMISVPIQQPKQETASSATKTFQQAPPTRIPVMGQGAPSVTQPAATPDTMPPAVAALVASFLSVFLFVIIGVYIFFCLCLYLIARKLDVSTAWMAWLPILQVAPLLGSAGKPIWWVLLFFIPFVNVVVSVYIWMCIAENLGKNKMLGLLTIIPIVNFIIMAILAFSKKEGSMSARPA